MSGNLNPSCFHNYDVYLPYTETNISTNSTIKYTQKVAAESLKESLDFLLLKLNAADIKMTLANWGFVYY